MPRIVPSQVVSFIDRFPLAERNDAIQLSDLEPYVLSSTLALIDQIPDELLTMDGAVYASLVEQKCRLKDILERWRKDAESRPPALYSPGTAGRQPARDHSRCTR